MYRAILAFSLLFSAACSQNLEEAAPLVDGTWTINGSLSNLSYVSIKADELAETNAFNRLSGSVTSSGLVTWKLTCHRSALAWISVMNVCAKFSL